METIKVIKTPRGTFNIKAVFSNDQEARDNGFGYYFTNDDGVDIYTKHIKEYSVYFATVEGGTNG